MFYEKWSHKVTLPLGTKWGNNIGGVAACLNWSRPPPKEDIFSDLGATTTRHYGGYTGRQTPLYTERPYKYTSRLYKNELNDDYPLPYTSGIATPDLGYYTNPISPEPYGLHLDDLAINNTRLSRPPSGIGMKSALRKTHTTNEDELLEKLKLLTRKNEAERKNRQAERNTKSKSKRLAFDQSLRGGDTSKTRGYGSMGPPPKRAIPTPPPGSRTRPPNPRPNSSAGKTETYRYTEREIVIEDIDDNTQKTTRKDLTVRPSSQQGYAVSNGRHSEKYVTNDRYNTIPKNNYGSVRYNGNTYSNNGRYSRPGSSAFGSKAMDKYYSGQQDTDMFSPTPIAWQTNELERPLSKAEFLRNRSQTPQRALTYDDGIYGRSSVKGALNTRRIPPVTKNDDNITIHVDCAKLKGTTRPQTVTVRLHGMDATDAENIKVLTVPNSAGTL